MPVDLQDYNTVAQRIVEFRSKHPQGSLQPLNPEKPFEIIEVGGKSFVSYTAAAFRAPDDPRPGIGVAWEPFPGKTSFTRDSELMNAETSAWGRAIVAALAADTTQSIASHEEVRNRQAEREEAPKSPSRNSSPAPSSRRPAAPSSPASDEDIAELVGLIHAAPDADSLNVLYKKAGALGALQSLTPDGKTTVQSLLYIRNDAIKSGPGDKGAENRKTAAAK